MSDKKLWSEKISRRSALKVVACTVGTAPIVLAITSPAQAAKIPQSSVGYQDSPKGAQKCGNCSLFVAPSSCKTVDGAVSENGWCKIWVKKT